jgi:hypothetical protein
MARAGMTAPREAGLDSSFKSLTCDIGGSLEPRLRELQLIMERAVRRGRIIAGDVGVPEPVRHQGRLDVQAVPRRRGRVLRLARLSGPMNHGDGFCM